ncbi:MAG: hypothetical protein V4596_09280, partial [Bdellovibrionota bacterium]
MGNFRLGFLKIILGVALFFSLNSNFAYAKVSCESLFSRIERQELPVAQATNIASAVGLRENPKLKIVTWNVFNLKIPEIEYPIDSEAYINTSKNQRMKFAKSEDMLLEMKRVFDELDADIYVLQEVFSK